MSQAAVYALQQDTKTLCEQSLHYLTYSINIDTAYLENNNFDETSLMKHQIKREKITHAQKYEKAKSIANRLYQSVLSLRTNQLAEQEAALLQDIELAIEANLKSLKSIKNIYHDLQDIALSTNEYTQSLYAQSRYKVACITKHLYDIVDDEYTNDDFEEARFAMNELDSFHA